MAVDATKLRRGIRRLGEPPTDSNPELSERHAPQRAPSNLAEPTPGAGGGAAPIPSPRGGPTILAPESIVSAPLNHTQRLPAGPADAFGRARYPDGRSRRRTGRIEQINVKVSAQFNTDLRGLADRQGLLIVEVLERALDAYLRVTAAAEASQRSVAQILDSLAQT
jgi:hypothetical protein